MKKIKKILDFINKYNLIGKIVMFIYIVCVVIIAFNHELSPDEAQSWLISRDLSLIDIIKQMKYEGHSFMWHFIIVPFAKLGLPIQSQKIITCTFAISTIYILWKKAPFNNFLKVLITFSSGMIYYYSAFARPYCMIPFLLVCIASIYKDKEKHPYMYAILLGCLSNTHLVMVPTSFLLAIFYYWKVLIVDNNSKEKKAIYIKSLIVFLLIFSVVIIMALQGFYNCNLVNEKNIIDLDIIFKSFKNTYTHSLQLLYGGYMIPLYFHILILVVLICCIIGTILNKKQGLIFWCQLILVFLIHSLFWFPIVLRMHLVTYTLMFWCWISRYDNENNSISYKHVFITIALVILIIITAPATYKEVYIDIYQDYTTGKKAAEFIKNNLPKDSVFIYTYKDLQQLIIGYLPKDDYKFYSVTGERFITFSIWDEKNNNRVNINKIEKAISNLYKQYDNIYIILVGKSIINGGGRYSVKKIYSSIPSNSYGTYNYVSNDSKVLFDIYEVKFNF